MQDHPHSSNWLGLHPRVDRSHYIGEMYIYGVPVGPLASFLGLE